MLVALLIGLAIGFVLAMPPGPVAVTAMRLSLDKGLKHSVMAGIGTGLMDFIYCAGAIFATTAVVKLLDNFVHDYPIIILVIQLAVVAAIVLYGYLNLKNKDKLAQQDTQPEQNSKFARFTEKLKHKGPFLLGIAVALANVANPTFLPSVMFMTLQVQNFSIFDPNSINNLLFALGFGFGNFLWLYLLTKVILHYKDRMSQKTLARIHQFAGITLIGFGTVLGYRVVAFTKWSEIIRLVFAF